MEDESDKTVEDEIENDNDVEENKSVILETLEEVEEEILEDCNFEENIEKSPSSSVIANLLPAKSQSESFSKVSEKPNEIQNPQRNQIKRTQMSLSSVSLDQKQLKLGQLPSYLRNSRKKSTNNFTTTMKKFQTEKQRLYQHQTDFLKLFRNCEKASKEATQVFHEKIKFVTSDDEHLQLLQQMTVHQELNEECLKSFQENYLKIVEILLEKFNSEENKSDHLEEILFKELPVKLVGFLKTQLNLNVPHVESTLKIEITNLQEEIQLLKKKLKSSESHSNDQLKRLNEQTKSLQSLRKKIEDLEIEKFSMETSLREKSEYIASLESRIKKSKKTTVNVPDEQINVLQEKIRNLEICLDKSTKENEDYKKMIEEKSNQSQKEIEIVEESSKTNADETKLTEEILSFKAELEFQKSNNRVKDNLLNLRGDLIKVLLEKELKFRNIISDLQSNIDELKKDSNQKLLQRKASLEEMTNLFNTLEQKQLDIDRLEHKLNQMEETKSKYEITIGKLQEKLRKLVEENKNLKSTY